MSTDEIKSPLAWPANVERTKSRQRARFGRAGAGSRTPLTFVAAMRRLEVELNALGAGRIVVSANLRLNMDSTPKASVEAHDPGVAVYFNRGDKALCFPCDRWDRPADNLAAIAAHLDAMRGQERLGVGTQDQAYLGYLAIPERAGASSWREVLGDWTKLSDAEARARVLLVKHHPDTGDGDRVAFQRVSDAREAARKEFSK